MNANLMTGVLFGVLAAALVVSGPAGAAAAKADAAAAQALVKKEKCTKCHDVKEKKEAKSFTEISKKYRGKANAEEKIHHHITSGEKVKLDDGSEEEHKIIKTKDKDEIQNLINWIRSIAA